MTNITLAVVFDHEVYKFTFDDIDDLLLFQI